jgi:hypothetical protein
MKLVNIGFGNLVNAQRVISVVAPESAPVKRLISQCKERGTLIDATQGRKTKSVIMMDSDHLVLSYLSTDVIMSRFDDTQEER